MERPGNQEKEGRGGVSETKEEEDAGGIAEDSEKNQEGGNHEGIGEDAAAGIAKETEEEDEIGQVGSYPREQGDRQAGAEACEGGLESPLPAEDSDCDLGGDLGGDGEDESVNGRTAGGRKVRGDVVCD